MERLMRFISLLALGFSTVQLMGYFFRFYVTLWVWWGVTTALILLISSILWVFTPATRLYTALLWLVWLGGIALAMI